MGFHRLLHRTNRPESRVPFARHNRRTSEWQKNGATGAITRFPLATVIVFLMMTAFFVTQSGFLDNSRFDDDLENPALNVNGDLEVYLPEGSKIAALLGKVEED